MLRTFSQVLMPLFTPLNKPPALWFSNPATDEGGPYRLLLIVDLLFLFLLFPKAGWYGFFPLYCRGECNCPITPFCSAAQQIVGVQGVAKLQYGVCCCPITHVCHQSRNWQQNFTYNFFLYRFCLFLALIVLTFYKHLFSNLYGYFALISDMNYVFLPLNLIVYI